MPKAALKSMPLSWSPDKLLGIFGMKGVLRYQFTIPLQTPSNNEIKEMSFWAYRALRKRIAYEALKAIGGRRPNKPIEQAFLVVRRYCAGSLDWSNCSGGIKPLEDALVLPRALRDKGVAKKRRGESNPDGIGLIYDDDRAHMPLHPWVEQLPAKRGEGYTEVLVYEISPQDTSVDAAQPAKNSMASDEVMASGFA